MGATTSSSQPPSHPIPYAKTYDVVDFRKTPWYMPYKYTTVRDMYMNFKPTTDKDIPEMMFCQLSKKKPVFFMQDEIKKTITGKGDSTCAFYENEFTGVHDGIYDIWLRDCKNVTKFWIEIEGVGPLYSIFEGPPDGDDIHIPLYITTEGHPEHQDKPIDSIMMEKHNDNMYVSFIPTIVFIYNKVKFYLNDGAEATLCASTLYLDMEPRRDLIKKNVFFQINGSPFFYPKPSSLGYCEHKKEFQVKRMMMK